MKMKSGVGWLMIIGSCLPGGGCPPHSDEYKNTENGKWRAEEGPPLGAVGVPPCPAVLSCSTTKNKEMLQLCRRLDFETEKAFQ